MMDDGKVTICQSVNVAEETHMPVMMLEPLWEAFFEERIVGYNRYYAALGVNQEISTMIRIWRLPVRIGMYVIIEDSEGLDGQYRIDFVKPLKDYDGLKIMDLTLSQLEENYAVKTREVLEVMTLYGDDITPAAEDMAYMGDKVPDVTSIFLDVDDGRIRFLLPEGDLSDRNWVTWNGRQSNKD